MGVCRSSRILAMAKAGLFTVDQVAGLIGQRRATVNDWVRRRTICSGDDQVAGGMGATFFLTPRTLVAATITSKMRKLGAPILVSIRAGRNFADQLWVMGFEKKLLLVDADGEVVATNELTAEALGAIQCSGWCIPLVNLLCPIHAAIAANPTAVAK